MFRCSSLLVATLLMLPALSPTAEAAEILVSTVSDAIIDGDNRCTLREAINSANADMPLHGCTTGDGADTIVLFFDSDHEMTLAGTNEDDNLTGDFDIKDDLTIRPMGSSVVEIEADGIDRIFHVHDGANLTLERLRLRRGNTVGFGGAIFTGLEASELTLRSTVVIDSQSTLFGGGISVAGPTLIVDSLVSGNQSAFGGGIYASSNSPVTLLRTEVTGNDVTSDGGGVHAATLLATESSISSNDAERHGGGFYWRDAGDATASYLVNTTVAYNEAWSNGGGLYVDGDGTLGAYNATIAYNAADSESNDAGDGGGIFVVDGTLQLRNSIVANNADLTTSGTVAPDCLGTVDSAGYNLFSAVDFGDCTITGATATDLNGSIGSPLDPGLDPCLEAPDDSNTSALLPLSDSIVVDAGNPNGCVGPDGMELVVDQVFNRRTWDGQDADQIARCDIGSIEDGAPSFTDIFADGFESGDTTAWGTSPLAPAPAWSTRRAATHFQRQLGGCEELTSY